MNKKLIAMLFLMAPIALFAQKFGHLNTMEIMQVMPELKAAETKLQNQRKEYSEDIERLQAEFLKSVNEYEAQMATLPETIKQRREGELQEMQIRMQERAQDYERQLQQDYEKEMSLISEKINKAIKEVGAAGGYLYIFDISSVPYINDTLSKDVTAEVKAKLGIQ